VFGWALNAIHKPLEGGFPALFHLHNIKHFVLVMRFAVILALALFSRQILAQSGASPRGCTLRIHVDGLRNSIGVVGTELFTSPAGWPENVDKSFRHGATQIGANERTVTALWQDVPPGNYGVVALHDENKNRKLDRNIFGIPKEGFGFANNPRVGISAPPFGQAIVHVTCPVTETTIHLIYK
jgi:uncharacterized protein (DUF2141 family)